MLEPLSWGHDMEEGKERDPGTRPCHNPMVWYQIPGVERVSRENGAWIDGAEKRAQGSS